MDQELDFDIANYTREDALATFDLPLSSSLEDIKIKSDKIIKQAKRQDAPALVKFYEQLAKKLVNDLLNTNEEELDINNESNRGIVYDYKTIQKPGPDALDKYKNNITYSVTSVRGDKNPVFRNEYTTMVAIDSMYRKDNSISSSNFLSTLSDTINNVIEYGIYDINIPYSWYTFSNNNGNTTFILDDEIIEIPDGNYASRLELLAAVINNSNEKIIPHDDLKALLTLNSITITIGSNALIRIALITYSNKIQIYSNDGNAHNITFYDVTKDCFENSDMNNNLGQHLGFKNRNVTNKLNCNTNVTVTNSTNYFIELTSNTDEYVEAPFTMNIYGTKYLLLKVNDYSLNRPPSNIITTTHTKTKLAYPSYFKSDLNFTQTGDNSHSIQITDDNKGYTQAQICTMNAILKERRSNTQSKILGFESSNDILCKIPIQDQNALFNSPNLIFTESGGFLSQFTRKFFGKVNILKIHTQLLDDKGRVIDLNGNDWTYTLTVKHLYQF